MSRLFVPLVIAATAVTVAIGGCTQPSSPPAATAPSAAPQKPSEPAKAPVSAPTLAPAAAQSTPAPAKPKVEFPEKGKTITLVVPWAAGGSTDVSARLLAPYLERDLGVPVQVVNKEGASSQVGITEVAASKPDGYTIGYTSLPQVPVLYLDPQRKTAFGRKDLQQVALYNSEAALVTVMPDSSFRTMKDIVDAARARPDKVTMGDPGLLSASHLGVLQLGKLAGVQFASVHFTGAAPSMTALLGGNIEVHVGWTGEVAPQAKSGKVRVIAIMAEEESPLWPGVKTSEAQGYKVNAYADRGYSVSGGTPKEIVDILGRSIKKAMEEPEVKRKAEEMALPLRYMGPEEFTKYWDEAEQQIKPLMALAR